MLQFNHVENDYHTIARDVTPDFEFANQKSGEIRGSEKTFTRARPYKKVTVAPE